MDPIVDRWLRLVALTLVLALTAPPAQARPELLVYDFHMNGTPAEIVEELRGLGFRGVVTRVRAPADLDKLAAYVEHVQTLDDFEVRPYVAYDFDDPASPGVWQGALPWLDQLDAPLWVVLRDAPSEAAMVGKLEEMARATAALGLQTVVYPHFNTSVESAREAEGLIAAAGHPNLRNSLHTAHEIRAGNQDDLRAVVQAHVAETEMVAIAGAEPDAYAGPPVFWITWDDVIQPLDEDEWSLLPFLQALESAGYEGRIVLQTYGITNDPGHLQRSLRRYAEYRAAIVERDDGP